MTATSDEQTPLDWRDVLRKQCDLLGVPMPSEQELASWAGFTLVCDNPPRWHAAYWAPAFLEREMDRYAASNGWQFDGARWICPSCASALASGDKGE